VPKGILLKHKAVSTSYLSHRQLFRLTPFTRFLQFASYTFNVYITEIITTLLYGSCIYIPSEGDRRNDLARVINIIAVNCADITPTITRLLNPNSVRTLTTLALRGENVIYKD
jgi:non-ribosomal peptide synthetase component F